MNSKSLNSWVARSASGLKLLALLAVVASAFLLASTLTIHQYAQTEVNESPFVLEVEGLQYDSSCCGAEAKPGQVIMRKRVARRSDGAYMLSNNAYGPLGLEKGLMPRRLEFPDGRVVLLADWITSKTTMPKRSDEELARRKSNLRQPASNCLQPGDTLLGTELVLGYPTVKIRQRSLPLRQGAEVTANPWVTTCWRAPTLACEELQSQVEVKQADGALKLTGATRPVSLKIGEPDPRLFDEGTNYTEVSPSDLIRKGGEILGLQIKEVPETRAADKAYFAGREP